MLPSHSHALSLSFALSFSVCVLACATTFCVTEGHKAITTTTERDDDDSCKCCACLGTGTDACWYFDSGITQPDSGNTSVSQSASRRSVKTLTQTLSNHNPIYVYATWQESVAVQHMQDTRQQLNSTLGGYSQSPSVCRLSSHPCFVCIWGGNSSPVSYPFFQISHFVFRLWVLSVFAWLIFKLLMDFELFDLLICWFSHFFCFAL